MLRNASFTFPSPWQRACASSNPQGPASLIGRNRGRGSDIIVCWGHVTEVGTVPPWETPRPYRNTEFAKKNIYRAQSMPYTTRSERTRSGPCRRCAGRRRCGVSRRILVRAIDKKVTDDVTVVVTVAAIGKRVDTASTNHRSLRLFTAPSAVSCQQ